MTRCSSRPPRCVRAPGRRWAADPTNSSKSRPANPFRHIAADGLRRWAARGGPPGREAADSALEFFDQGDVLPLRVIGDRAFERLPGIPFGAPDEVGHARALAAGVALARLLVEGVAPEEADLDYILDERARELYGEEFRHITLRRMGKLLERVRKYNNNPVYPACNIQDYNVLFPIPQSMIDLNINGDFQQNPGY